MHQEVPQNAKINFRYEWRDICYKVHRPFLGLLSPKIVSV